MLIDYEYKSFGKKLIVSYIEKGNIKLKYYPWTNPTKHIICSDDDPQKDGKYVTWDGKSVKQIYTSNPGRYSVHYFLDSLPKEERDLLFKYDEPNFFSVDIENEITEGGKPQPQLANSEIQTISISNGDRALVMGTRDLSDDQMKSINSDINTYFAKLDVDYKFKYIKYRNEYEMLLNFFHKYVPNMPVIAGWNFKEYDWVFLVNRARKLGIDPTISSFTGKLTTLFDKSGKKDNYFENPAHRLIVDYMELWAKPWAWPSFTRVKEADSLDFAAECILGLKKVNYETNLKHLYETDYKKFVFYNMVDSILVQKIHEKARFIDIMYGISVLSKTRVIDAYNTVPVTEGILREKLKLEKNVVLCRDENKEKGESVEGGWVKDPIKGMNPWTVCYDFASLYPTSIREFNISPDAYKGILSSDNKYAIFAGHKLPIESDDIITVNNAVYSSDEGIVTRTMGEIYSERKKYKKLMMGEHEKAEMIKQELKKLEEELLMLI